VTLKVTQVQVLIPVPVTRKVIPVQVTPVQVTPTPVTLKVTPVQVK